MVLEQRLSNHPSSSVPVLEFPVNEDRLSLGFKLQCLRSPYFPEAGTDPGNAPLVSSSGSLRGVKFTPHLERVAELGAHRTTAGVIRSRWLVSRGKWQHQGPPPVASPLPYVVPPPAARHFLSSSASLARNSATVATPSAMLDGRQEIGHSGHVSGVEGGMRIGHENS